MFGRSIDASSYMKTGLEIFDLLNLFVQEIGKGNVVQVLSDNGRNYLLKRVDEPARVTRHHSRLVTLVFNGDEELEMKEEEFESSDEKYDINVVELKSEDEADVI
ncbi:hypothetical protein KIW84_043032 [Lathyrus oleraceus]|uniref:DUF659 domain-containing protein n=1 Tax=Pisum sativum TaxID=3888 RepID=A0A9D4XE61_PEA|nr:hypothetical protein KIW84_043032 [Pisum sativum]